MAGLGSIVSHLNRILSLGENVRGNLTWPVDHEDLSQNAPAFAKTDAAVQAAAQVGINDSVASAPISLLVILLDENTEKECLFQTVQTPSCQISVPNSRQSYSLT